MVEKDTSKGVYTRKGTLDTADESAFTVAVTTNNPKYIEGGAKPYEEQDCCGYIMFLFSNDSDSVRTQAHGKTDMCLLMQGLLNLSESSKLLDALSRAIAIKASKG